MNISTEKAVEQAQKSQPYTISGRCSVFCKSDCTHALNKSEPIGNITAGLCQMMARKIIELMPCIPKRNILCIGGVTKNQAALDILNKEIENLIVPKEATYFEAYGTSVWAFENSKKFITENIFEKPSSSFRFLPPLSRFSQYVKFKESPKSKPMPNDICVVGLDVGSTTTKAVLIRKSDNAILASCYLRTNGDPVGASRRCLSEIDKVIQFPIKIEGLGVTGSGRYISALYAKTDAVINEINHMQNIRYSSTQSQFRTALSAYII